MIDGSREEYYKLLSEFTIYITLSYSDSCSFLFSHVGNSPIDAALSAGYKVLASKIALWASIELRAKVSRSEELFQIK